MKPEKTPVTSTQEKYFLNTFPLMNFIVLRKLNVFYSDYVEDIKQKVALNLWKWKLRRPEKELSQEKWKKIVNTSTQNEIKRIHVLQMNQAASLTEFPSPDELENVVGALQTSSPEGNTKIEVRSLLLQMWKVIKEQTLREKTALLLQSREIINHLYSYQCCDIKEIAGALEITVDEFHQLYNSLPMRDKEIGQWLGTRLKQEIKAEQIIKARQRMRAKLQPFQIARQIKITDERTFVAGKNEDVSERRIDCG